MKPAERSIAWIWGFVLPLALSACEPASEPSSSEKAAAPETPPAAHAPAAADPATSAETPTAPAAADGGGAGEPPKAAEEPPAAKAPEKAEEPDKKKGWPVARKGSDHVFGSTGWIKGVVKLSKEAKAALRSIPRLDMSADPQCARLHSGTTVASQQLVLGENDAVKNVFVRIRPSDLAGYAIPPVPEEPSVITFKDCLFAPTMYGIRTGQALRVINSDNVVHQILVERSRPFEALLDARAGIEKKAWFEVPEMGIELRCGFHIWEIGYICVAPHPAWGVSNELGQVYIPNVPTGEFTLEFWHPPVPGLKLPEPRKIRVRSVKGAASLFLAMFEPAE